MLVLTACDAYTMPVHNGTDAEVQVTVTNELNHQTETADLRPGQTQGFGLVRANRTGRVQPGPVYRVEAFDRQGYSVFCEYYRPFTAALPDAGVTIQRGRLWCDSAAPEPGRTDDGRILIGP